MKIVNISIILHDNCAENNINNVTSYTIRLDYYYGAY